MRVELKHLGIGEQVDLLVKVPQVDEAVQVLRPGSQRGFHNPGNLFETGFRGEVPRHDVLQVQRDVVLEQVHLVLSFQGREERLREREVRQRRGDLAQLVDEVLLVDLSPAQVALKDAS